MGALRQPHVSEESLRKPPQTATKTKNESTPLDKLRARTDYGRGDGWSAFPHAAFVDLCKLSSGEVCFRFVLAVNISLSSGSARSPKEAWASWSEFHSSQEWADLCSVNVRDIQRQLTELQDRGIIGVKQIRQSGAVKYSVSLLYPKWGEIDSYAVWKRRQVVAIDEAAAELAEDEAPAVVSKDAVKLTRAPQTIRPGRASRAIKVNVGVSELSFQNDSTTIDAAFQAVVTSGRLVVSATFKKGESEAKGEDKGNAARHGCRAVPTNEGIQNTPIRGELVVSHPRLAELVKIFDPILAASHAPLLSENFKALQSACEAVQDCDHDYLVKFAIQRAERQVKSPLYVKSICAEALASWKASKVLDGAGLKDPIWDEIEAQAQREREALRLAKEKRRKK